MAAATREGGRGRQGRSLALRMRLINLAPATQAYTGNSALNPEIRTDPIVNGLYAFGLPGRKIV